MWDLGGRSETMAIILGEASWLDAVLIIYYYIIPKLSGWKIVIPSYYSVNWLSSPEWFSLGVSQLHSDGIWCWIYFKNQVDWRSKMVYAHNWLLPGNLSGAVDYSTYLWPHHMAWASIVWKFYKGIFFLGTVSIKPWKGFAYSEDSVNISWISEWKKNYFLKKS